MSTKADDIAARGRALYEQQIRQEVEPGNSGKILVINTETGEYEMDSDHLTASDRAADRFPGALLYAMKIGFPKCMNRIKLNYPGAD